MFKKIGYFVAAAVLLAVSSCEEKIQTTTGKVKKLNDSTMVATIDKYDITFDMKQVRFDNGVVIPGDSAVIHYIGDLRDKQAKALLIKLIPPKPRIVEAVYNPDAELKTRPMSKEEQKEFEEGIKYAKEHGL
ncbi:MAG: hypothetical protein ACI3Y0_01550 [Prevotella sp.]